MWLCAMSGVSEPVAVEVGEEHLGLAYVRVTVEHSSYKMASLSSQRGVCSCYSLCFSPPAASPLAPINCTRTLWRNRTTESGVYCFFSHTTYFFKPQPRAPPHRHTAGHTHSHTHSHFAPSATLWHARTPRLTGTHASARGRPHMQQTIHQPCG